MILSSKTSASFLSESRDGDEIDFTDYSSPFISGHGFSLRCHWWYSPNMTALGVNPNRDNECVYVKTDDLPKFFSSGLVPKSFILVTHNSDFVISAAHSRFLDDPRLKLWLAMNKGVEHPKLKSIPDGLQNACYGYGNVRLISAVADALGDGLPFFQSYKTSLFFACYTIDSRIKERGACAAVCQPQGIMLRGRMPYINYVAEMSSSMFVLAPAGSGVDSCRPWEAIYLRAVPIVTSSFTAIEHSYMPMVIVNAWNETAFNIKQFSVDLYKEKWCNFDPAEAQMDGYCKRLNRLYGVGL